MQYHNTDWQEYQEADGRAFFDSITQHLIKAVWEELFTLDSVSKKASTQRSGMRKRMRKVKKKPLVTSSSSEVEEQCDPWEAKEEAARWMHVDNLTAEDGRTDALLRGTS